MTHWLVGFFCCLIFEVSYFKNCSEHKLSLSGNSLCFCFFSHITLLKISFPRYFPTFSFWAFGWSYYWNRGSNGCSFCLVYSFYKQHPFVGLGRDLHSSLINTKINRPLKLSATPASSAGRVLEDQARWQSQAPNTHNVCSVALGFNSLGSWLRFRRLKGGGSRFSTIHLFCGAAPGRNPKVAWEVLDRGENV